MNEIKEATARSLRVIVGAMGAGLAMLTAAILYIHFFQAAGRVPTPRSVGFINLMTMVAMTVAVAGIGASEFLWRRMLRTLPGTLDEKVSQALVLRSALREGPALLGLVTLFLAAQGGVLRVYPAYWADAAPAALFWSYLFLHWPTVENLKAETAAVLNLP